MAEEQLADDAARRIIGAMRITKGEVGKLELKTLRDLQRACEQLAAECRYYVPVRLLQGGAKSQHAKQARAKK